MGRNGNYITSTGGICPIRDISPALGIAANGDIGYLCSNAHGKTNKWAKYKPVRHSKIADITDGERTGDVHGLSLSYVAADATAAQGLLSALQAAIPSSAAWGYLPPRAGTDWQRITDWLSPSGVNGYNHAAMPPLNGFKDITIYDSEFGSETKTWSFNFRWGAASWQGNGTLTGIEIPLNELMDGIDDGTWRLALLVCFPRDGKYNIAVASSPGPIASTNDSTAIANMMIRPTGTGQLKQLMQNAYDAGVRELVAVPVIAKGLSRGGSGVNDKWSGATKLVGMPNGERIKILLKPSVASVSVSFNSITITYVGSLDSPSYTLVPSGGSGQSSVQLAKPSASGSTSAQIDLDFTITVEGASVLFPPAQLNAGIGKQMTTGGTTLLQSWNGSAWVSATGMQIPVSGRRYRIHATDNSSSTRTAIMEYLEGLPRRTPPQDVHVVPCISIQGRVYQASNYFIHKG